MHTFNDDRGHSLMSVYDHLAEIPGQVNVSTMYPSVVKAWHRHTQQIDHWTVPVGNLKVGLFNSENATLTAKLRMATSVPNGEVIKEIPVEGNSGRPIFLGEHTPGVLEIPVGLWHGATAVGGREAVLLYYVTQRYDAANPDEERAAWDAFPFPWNVEFK